MAEAATKMSVRSEEKETANLRREIDEKKIAIKKG
jgi:hypothetical protein